MSENIHPDAIIIDRPYLYGLAMDGEGRILSRADAIAARMA
jgi:hypothetical protein